MGIGRLSDGLAPTPPLGWNSWNGFRTRIDERVIVETAEAMVARGMRDAGYRYVVIDDGWMAPERSPTGDLVPDPEKFPRGIAALADDVHRLGLRFGIYTDAGTRTCAELPASLGYEFRDARAFAGWGVDFVKVDWCHTDGLGPRALYAKWAMAVHATGRPMILSICEWGRSHPWTWAGPVGHMWRTSWDIQPTWASIMKILDRQVALHPYAGPDHWNDPDMLEVGNGALSLDESRAHFALWAMLAAPLLAGNDLRSMSDEIRDVLTAPEILAIDQDRRGAQGRRLRADGETEIWARELAHPGRRAVALLNRGDGPKEISVSGIDLSARTIVRARDLWARADAPTSDGSLSFQVRPHAAMLLSVDVGER